MVPGGQCWLYCVFSEGKKFDATKPVCPDNISDIDNRDNHFSDISYINCINFIDYINRPFPSSLVPLFQSESKCETILMKMTLICMKMKLHAELIFISKVSHLDSF